MIRALKVLALVLATIYLPLVMKSAGAQPEPFSVHVNVASDAYGGHVYEPFVEVAVRPAANPGSPLFQGFTDDEGYLWLGVFAGLPQDLYVEVKRDRVDSAMQHTLPLVRCDADEPVEPRSTLSCHATYYYPQGTSECHCYVWTW